MNTGLQKGYSRQNLYKLIRKFTVKKIHTYEQMLQDKLPVKNMKVLNFVMLEGNFETLLY